ncbi:MAG: histidine phosphatase family protein [Methylobacteriaceae bacterium]|jgi:probable phosphoglycerate mutase|nr:histidine phosphatase family protein [Methylobacteriaceae bacterium]
MIETPGGIEGIPGPFYYLRHGETLYNRLELLSGWREIDLTDKGRAQAQRAAGLLAGKGITHIYSSRLPRALETAQPVAEALGLDINVLWELNERRYGVLEGRSRSLRRPGFTPEGGESWEEFSERVNRAIMQVSFAGLPLVVAHAGVYRVIKSRLGLPEWEARVDNALPVYLERRAGDGNWTATPLGV